MNHPQTAALQALLERVEAGEFKRVYGPDRYSAFGSAIYDAGLGWADCAVLVSALREGTAAETLRALIATADTEGR